MSCLQTPASSFGVPSSLALLACWLHIGGSHYSFTFDHSLGRLTELTRHSISDHRFIVKVINQNQPKGETQRARLGAWGGRRKQEASRSSPSGFRRLCSPSTSMHDILRVWPTKEAHLNLQLPSPPQRSGKALA